MNSTTPVTIATCLGSFKADIPTRIAPLVSEDPERWRHVWERQYQAWRTRRLLHAL